MVLLEMLPAKLPRNLEDIKAVMSVNHAQRIGQWLMDISALVHKNTVGHVRILRNSKRVVLQNVSAWLFFFGNTQDSVSQEQREIKDFFWYFSQMVF